MPAALIFLFGCGFVVGAVLPLAFAQRALCAAAIFFLTAALILRLFFGEAATAALADEPKIRYSLSSSDCILSLMFAARRSCLADRLAIEFMAFN